MQSQNNHEMQAMISQVMDHRKSCREPACLLSCPGKGTTARASTVLNRNIPLYGPENALYTSDTSSCWNSDQAPTNATDQQQVFQINFNRTTLVHQIKVMFQGGFAPLQCQLSARCEGGLFQPIKSQIIELKDCNDLQEFDLPLTRCEAMRLSLGESTDFYGRITIYRLEVWGWEEKEEKI